MDKTIWLLNTASEEKQATVFAYGMEDEDIKQYITRLRVIAHEFFGSYAFAEKSDEDELITMWFSINSGNTPDCILNDPELLAKCLSEFMTKQTGFETLVSVNKISTK